MSSFFAKGLILSDHGQTSNRSRFFEAHARDFGLSYPVTTLTAGSWTLTFLDHAHRLQPVLAPMTNGRLP
jgi:hypothetical protein